MISKFYFLQINYINLLLEALNQKKEGLWESPFSNPNNLAGSRRIGEGIVEVGLRSHCKWAFGSAVGDAPDPLTRGAHGEGGRRQLHVQGLR